MIRALLVDDEEPARARLRRLLGLHADVECVGEAGDGLRALALVDELRPDVVFLDIQVPELDGLSVAAALTRPGPAVIFATAFDEHAIRAFELAAIDRLPAAASDWTRSSSASAWGRSPGSRSRSCSTRLGGDVDPRVSGPLAEP